MPRITITTVFISTPLLDHIYRESGRVFANNPGDQGSIPDHVTP